MKFIIENWGLIATAGWAICEILARLPQVKANSTTQAVINWVQTLFKK